MKIFKTNNIIVAVEVDEFLHHQPQGDNPKQGSSDSCWIFFADMRVHLGKMLPELSNVEEIDRTMIDLEDFFTSKYYKIPHKVVGPSVHDISSSICDIENRDKDRDRLVVELVVNHNGGVDLFKTLWENDFDTSDLFVDSIDSWVQYVEENL